MLDAPKMHLPRAEMASVDERKVANYLLNAAHPGNGGKSRFFGKLGYKLSDSLKLQEALLRHATIGRVVVATESRHGVKFVVQGSLEPNGTNVATRDIRTVWIVEKGATVPRLVTAYPFRRRREDDAR